jgi:hypothetical protein
MSTPSYETINYSLRPAKAIERKMLCDLFHRLSSFNPLNDYQYVGFGSTYFSDFSQFHKTLGVTDLISIEQDIQNSKRFKFNVPYSCIKLIFGHSNEILPTLSFDNKPTILWLDYDYPLDSTVLDDIRTFATNALEGSVIIITVNAHPFSKPGLSVEELKTFRYKKLVENVGEIKIPIDTDGSVLNMKGLAQVYRQIITDEVNSTIKIRNDGKLENNPNRLYFNQLVNFEYQDGAKMLTTGGIIYNGYLKNSLQLSKIDQLDFYRNGQDPFEIKVPSLTFREIHQLESLLPSGLNLKTGEILNESGMIQDGIKNITEIIPLEDAIQYSEIYRYFPIFRESII